MRTPEEECAELLATIRARRYERAVAGKWVGTLALLAWTVEIIVKQNERISGLEEQTKGTNMNEKLTALREAHAAILAEHGVLLGRARGMISTVDTAEVENLLLEVRGMRRAAKVVQDMITAEATR